MDIFYQNINRKRSKIYEIYSNILLNNFDMICLSETNFNNTVFDNEIFDNRYNIFRRDRFSTKICKIEGGGVAVALKKKV